jgi:hypothetical protein
VENPSSYQSKVERLKYRQSRQFSMVRTYDRIYAPKDDTWTMHLHIRWYMQM